MSRSRVEMMVASAAVLGGLIMMIWASSQPDRYQVTTVMAVGPAPSVTDEANIIDIVGSLDRGGIIATAAGLADSGSIRNAAAEDLDLAGALGEYEIDSIPVLSSNLFDITVSGPEAETVADLANAVGTRVQTEFAELYGIYRIEFVTRATPPTNSDRPGVVLVTLAGALAAGGAAAAVLWAAYGGRWRVAGHRGEELDGDT